MLLPDEPTTGLDPRIHIGLWDMIGDLAAAGTDIVLTTQYLDEADHLASRIVIIDRSAGIDLALWLVGRLHYPGKGGIGERAAWFRGSEGNLLAIGRPVRQR